jgi:hypothetical protein
MAPVVRVASPSGDLIVAAIPSENKSDPKKYQCIRLILQSRDGGTLTAVQTSVSNGQKWAVGWMEKGDIIVLYSSDIGTQAYGVASNALNLVALTPDIEERAKQLKKAKYGN